MNDPSIHENTHRPNGIDSPRPFVPKATAVVIGAAVSLFTTVSALFSVWPVAPIFAPLLVLFLAATTLAGIAAARRLRMPGFGWPAVILAALVAWPIAAVLPYGALVGELYLRVDFPALPPDATKVEIRALPLSSGSSYGPAPGFVAEYVTPLAPDLAMISLRSTLPMSVNRQEGEYLFAIPNPDQAQVIIEPEGTGARVKVGIFGDYTSKLPWLMVLGGWTWIAVVVFTRRKP